VAPIQVLRARKESKVLEEKFGDEYRQYKRSTWF
jgi:protein-S-isoprenylcysteine O-methyltransferase Ste14